jgi:hypothetical protein
MSKVILVEPVKRKAEQDSIVEMNIFEDLQVKSGHGRGLFGR